MWMYDGGDPGIQLFTACLDGGAPIRIEAGMRILEVGCCESDWLQRAHEAWPQTRFIGVDLRAKTRIGRSHMTIPGNVLEPDIVEPESCDAIVSLSAIEHMGLGHYGDPLDPDGDARVVLNCWKWLKPGGWLYFDVPYDPTGYRVQGTECRVYDTVALVDRLGTRWTGPWRWTGYCASDNARTLIPAPQEPHHRFWYTAMVWQKA